MFEKAANVDEINVMHAVERLARRNTQVRLLVVLADGPIKSPADLKGKKVALFGLGGIPPTIGFAGKLLIFVAAVQKGYLALVLIAGDIVDYQWDFGDDSTGAGPTPNHTYTTDGQFTVTLIVTDDAGDTGSYETTVTIGDRPWLFGLAGGRTVAVGSLELWPGDRVRYRKGSDGRVVSQDVTWSQRESARPAMRSGRSSRRSGPTTAATWTSLCACRPPMPVWKTRSRVWSPPPSPAAVSKCGCR